MSDNLESIRVDTGEIITTTVDTFGFNWDNFLLVGALGFGVPGLLQAYMVYLTKFGSNEGLAAAKLLLSLAIGVAAIFASSALLVGALAASLERKMTTLDMFSDGINHFWQIFGIRFATQIGVVIGLLLLVVPGIVLFSAWCVTAPACIQEDITVERAFARSATLTRGLRVRVLIVWAVFGLGVAVLFLGAMAILSLMGGWRALFSSEANPMVNLVTAFLSTLIEPLLACLSVALYSALVRLKEGGNEQTLASAFS